MSYLAESCQKPEEWRPARDRQNKITIRLFSLQDVDKPNELRSDSRPLLHLSSLRCAPDSATGSREDCPLIAGLLVQSLQLLLDTCPSQDAETQVSPSGQTGTSHASSATIKVWLCANELYRINVDLLLFVFVSANAGSKKHGVKSTKRTAFSLFEAHYLEWFLYQGSKRYCRCRPTHTSTHKAHYRHPFTNNGCKRQISKQYAVLP